MQVMILFNPISGKGRAAVAAQELAAALTRAGHVAVCTPTRLEPTESWLDQALRSVDLAVIAGGDGAIRMAGSAAVRTGTAIYHFPCGTENLFAREFGMTRDPDVLIQAINRHSIHRLDMGVVNGWSFFLMLSVGYDAEVVHDLASHRGKSISHLTYVRPMINQLWRWKPPRLQVTVDGERIDQNQPGFLIVANSRQYGFRLDPASRALMDDGLLDVAFFPTRNRRELIRWVILCKLQRQFGNPRLIYKKGKTVEITCSEPQRFEIDGDPPEQLSGENGFSAPGGWPLTVRIEPGVLPVLVP